MWNVKATSLNAVAKRKRPSEFSLHANMWTYLNFTVFGVCDQWLEAVVLVLQFPFDNFNLLFSSTASSSLIFMYNLRMPVNYLSSWNLNRNYKLETNYIEELF